jgi:hypothetical protein
MKAQLTEADVAKAMEWPIGQVRDYVAAGMADGYVKSSPLGFRFDPVFPEFLRWYVARLDDALAGKLHPLDLDRMVGRKRGELRRKDAAAEPNFAAAIERRLAALSRHS